MQMSLARSMPSVRALARRGITFNTARYQVPLCGPSRSTFLTGRYAQNTGVYVNSHSQFYLAGNPSRTFAVSLLAAGYRTAWIGKYINGSPSPEAKTYIPPGWSSWYGRLAAADGSSPYNYQLNENGVLQSYGTLETDYATDVYLSKALAFIDGAVTAAAPFFVMVSVQAPHDPSTPAPRHASVANHVVAPRPPSFNEADVSDKPSFIRTRKPYSSATLATADSNYRHRVRSLKAVDEALAAIVQRLTSHGILGNTYVVFLSDNGMLFGEHRIMRSKGGPYEESTGVPLVIRGPGVPAGASRDHLVTNADLAATFSEWAGATPPPDMDGRSLAPLLRKKPPGPGEWRQSLPITLVRNSSTPNWPGYYGVRTRDHMYAHYDTGDRELYDLRVDPYQLQNIVDAVSPDFVTRLDDHALQLNACRGEACRQLENLSLTP